MTPHVLYPWKGSAGMSVTASRAAAATPTHMSASSRMRPRNGANHATYHGNRYGMARASNNSALPHASAGDYAGRASPRSIDARPNRHRSTTKRAHNDPSTTALAVLPAPEP